MKTKDIDELLKNILCHEINTPQELEKITWHKMNTVPRKKRGFIFSITNVTCYIFLALETIAVLSYFNLTALKFIFLYFIISSFLVLLFFQFVSNINLKKIYE